MKAFRTACAAPLLAAAVLTALPASAELRFTPEHLEAVTLSWLGGTPDDVVDSLRAVLEKYSDGEPTGYIVGRESYAQFVLGFHEGRGCLVLPPDLEIPVSWQGPSFGIRTGFSVGKTVAVLFGVHEPSELYQRFEAVQVSFLLPVAINIRVAKSARTERELRLVTLLDAVGVEVGAATGYVSFARDYTVEDCDRGPH